MPFSFRTIDLDGDLATCIEFRKDSFRVSFNGREDGFDEAEYAESLAMRTALFPWGYVMVEDQGKITGQMELFTRLYEGRTIGFVSLYYLIPEVRGKGYGWQLSHYAEDCFRHRAIPEYHLRVSPTNIPAVRFYEKCGLQKIKEEQGEHVVWRMGKLLE